MAERVTTIGASPLAHRRLADAIAQTREAFFDSKPQVVLDDLTKTVAAADLVEDPRAGTLGRLAAELDGLIERYLTIEEVFLATTFPEEFGHLAHRAEWLDEGLERDPREGP
jgi:hypothetical protein